MEIKLREDVDYPPIHERYVYIIYTETMSIPIAEYY